MEELKIQFGLSISDGKSIKETSNELRSIASVRTSRRLSSYGSANKTSNALLENRDDMYLKSSLQIRKVSFSAY